MTIDVEELTYEDLMAMLRWWHYRSLDTAAQVVHAIEIAMAFNAWYIYCGDQESAGKWEERARKLAEHLFPVSTCPVEDALETGNHIKVTVR